jgi:hypothetical protein
MWVLESSQLSDDCVAKLRLRRLAKRDSVRLRQHLREQRMLGRQESGQGQFFYSFDLDKVVPPDHLVRQIDGLLDLSWVHNELAPFYSRTGRPSIDPVLMIRMLIVGYVFALRSDRRLCAEVQVNLWRDEFRRGSSETMRSRSMRA